MTPIEQIKDKLDIVAFIGSYIQLKPAGKNFKANCPFHGEKTPSFMVSPERQTWHCFGACSEGGDIFKFIMKFENLEFYEALKILAEKAGVELKKISPSDQKQFGVLYDINESAKDFFKKLLPNNKVAIEYLKLRNLKGETAAEFELGVSPDSFDELSVYLINYGYDIKDIERSGLNYKNDKGKYIDRFRNRIMFPIYNSFGKTVGFSARILPQYDNGETGKYINSPETPIYNKSRTLYGFNKSKSEIRERKSVLLVEGQMDFLMLWQDGVKNAVATSGTALTADHLTTLKKSADEIIFLFDNDEAGLKAVERSIDLAAAFDFTPKILVLHDYKDPAEAVEKNSGFMKEFVNTAKPAMKFYFDRYFKKEEAGSGKWEVGNLKNNLRVVLAKIKNIASPVEQNYWLKELGSLANIGESSLVQEMEKLKTSGQAAIENKKIPVSNNSQTRRELISERLLTLVSIKDSLAPKLLNCADLLPVKYKIAFESLINKEKPVDLLVADLLNDISLRSGLEIELLGEGKIDSEFDELLSQLQSESHKERKKELSILIKEAEKNSDEKQLAEALKKFDEISKLPQN